MSSAGIKYILDTDICSYIIRKRPESVLKKFTNIDLDQIAVSVITYAELLYGIEKTKSVKTNLQVIKAFIEHLSILEWDMSAAEEYSKIRVFLEKKGIPIGSMDTMIAAHALSVKATVITNNNKHFSRIPGLRVENWV